MTVEQVAAALDCQVLSGSENLGRDVLGGYASDLLSCAMAGLKAGAVWVTLQAHQNVVAVAGLTGAACVIISEGTRPDAATVERADKEGVVLLAIARDTFGTILELARLGVGSEGS